MDYEDICFYYDGGCCILFNIQHCWWDFGEKKFKKQVQKMYDKFDFDKYANDLESFFEIIKIWLSCQLSHHKLQVFIVFILTAIF